MRALAPLALACAPSALLAQTGEPSAVLPQIAWSELGPAPIGGAGHTGRVSAIACSPSDPDRYFVAGADGGASFLLRLSGNAGWPRVTRELSVHPGDPLTAWLAVGSFGVEQILETSDGGVSWSALDANLPDVPVNVVAVLPGTPRRIFAGTDAGLLFSPDGGASWRPCGKGLPRTPVIDVLLEPARGRIVVATQGRGVWRASL